MSKEKNVQEGMMEIPHDYLIEGVRKAVSDVRKMMADSRIRYGARYNEKNDYEQFRRRFGYDDPEKIWEEFRLVWDKQSSQPASVRGVIRLLGDKARYYAVERMRKEARETEEKGKEDKEG